MESQYCIRIHAYRQFYDSVPILQTSETILVSEEVYLMLKLKLMTAYEELEDLQLMIGKYFLMNRT